MTKDFSKLLYKKTNGFKSMSDDELDEVFGYAIAYKKFLDNSKIEREAVRYAIGEAITRGYSEATFDSKLSVGDKIFFNNKDKCIALVKIGKNGLKNGVRMIISHVDSPRLDLKQLPLYEKNDTAYLKTHYYGGIKQYQWLTVPLAMHGRIMLKDGSSVDVALGEKEDDPIFYISDLLPHLSKDKQNQKLKDVFVAENLNIICGGIPAEGVEKDAFKCNVLAILNDMYGLVEEDFLSAEIEFVPALKARDVGFDRSYIAAYGHDDKVCAYSGLTALFDSNDENTSIMYFVDKEEIGSNGVSGAESKFVMDVIEKLSNEFGENFANVRAKSMCISADVTSAYDSNFSEAFESQNSSYLSHGVAVNKYTGAAGKSGTSDASAELTSYIRDLFDSNNVLWQAGEIGKIDQGGGGTVAKFIANQNIDTIDIGVPVISMHAPYELISKMDLYSAYKGYKAFFNK